MPNLHRQGLWQHALKGAKAKGYNPARTQKSRKVGIMPINNCEEIDFRIQLSRFPGADGN